MATHIFDIEYIESDTGARERIRVEEDAICLLHSLSILEGDTWVLVDRVNRIDRDSPRHKLPRDKLVRYLMKMYAKEHNQDYQVVIH